MTDATISKPYYPTTYLQYLSHTDMRVRLAVLTVGTLASPFFGPQFILVALGLNALFIGWQYYNYRCLYPKFAAYFTELVRDMDESVDDKVSEYVLRVTGGRGLLMCDIDGTIKSVGASPAVLSPNVSVSSNSSDPYADLSVGEQAWRRAADKNAYDPDYVASRASSEADACAACDDNRCMCGVNEEVADVLPVFTAKMDWNTATSDTTPEFTAKLSWGEAVDAKAPAKPTIKEFADAMGWELAPKESIAAGQAKVEAANQIISLDAVRKASRYYALAGRGTTADYKEAFGWELPMGNHESMSLAAIADRLYVDEKKASVVHPLTDAELAEAEAACAGLIAQANEDACVDAMAQAIADDVDAEVIAQVIADAEKENVVDGPGMRLGELTTFAARSGGGKSSLSDGYFRECVNALVAADEEVKPVTNCVCGNPYCEYASKEFGVVDAPWAGAGFGARESFYWDAKEIMLSRHEQIMLFRHEQLRQAKDAGIYGKVVTQTTAENAKWRPKGDPMKEVPETIVTEPFEFGYNVGRRENSLGNAPRMERGRKTYSGDTTPMDEAEDNAFIASLTARKDAKELAGRGNTWSVSSRGNGDFDVVKRTESVRLGRTPYGGFETVDKASEEDGKELTLTPRQFHAVACTPEQCLCSRKSFLSAVKDEAVKMPSALFSPAVERQVARGKLRRTPSGKVQAVRKDNVTESRSTLELSKKLSDIYNAIPSNASGQEARFKSALQKEMFKTIVAELGEDIMLPAKATPAKRMPVRQVDTVYNLLESDGGWYTLKELARTTGFSEASVSARLRDLRKTQFGAHDIERRFVSKGLYEYRLVV